MAAEGFHGDLRVLQADDEGGFAGGTLSGRHRDECFRTQRGDLLSSHVAQLGMCFFCDSSEKRGALGSRLELDAFVRCLERSCLFGPTELEPLASGVVFLLDRADGSRRAADSIRIGIGILEAVFGV